MSNFYGSRDNNSRMWRNRIAAIQSLRNWRHEIWTNMRFIALFLINTNCCYRCMSVPNTVITIIINNLRWNANGLSKCRNWIFCSGGILSASSESVRHFIVGDHSRIYRRFRFNWCFLKFWIIDWGVCNRLRLEEEIRCSILNRKRFRIIEFAGDDIDQQ